jgi:hypothetical protein
MSKTPVHHYVDNDKFYAAMKEYKAKIQIAKDSGLKRNDPHWPQVSEYIGECFLKIAKHLAFKANFINYSFRDEMISDGIENCLRYADNFDETKYKNPFAYFTQIVYFAFVRRIQAEKKELKRKYRYIMSLDIHDLITQSQDEGEFANEFLKYLQDQVDLGGGVDDEEDEKPKKKATKKAVKKRVATIDDI